jgi:hypothetical protein
MKADQFFLRRTNGRRRREEGGRGGWEEEISITTQPTVSDFLEFLRI